MAFAHQSAGGKWTRGGRMSAGRGVSATLFTIVAQAFPSKSGSGGCNLHPVKLTLRAQFFEL